MTVSTFDNLAARMGAPMLLRLHGRSGVKYIDGENDDLTLAAAAVGPIIKRNQDGQHGRRRVLERLVSISTDPNSSFGGVVDPGTHAKLEIDGVDWAIEEIGPIGGGLAQLRVTRPESGELSRAAYRAMR